MASAPRPLSDRLSDRQRVVLHSVIEHYVRDAEPVASRIVAERSGLSLSPASIRAAMAELTELGLLAQPHVSAGRVPTDRAFRWYVDALCSSEAIPYADDALDLESPEGGLTEVLRRAADQLGRATGQMAFYVGRPGEDVVLERIHFVRVASDRVLALLVSHGHLVQSRLIDEAECDVRRLDQISGALSEIVAGCTLGEARARLASKIELDRALTDELRKVFVLGWEGLAGSGEVELYLAERNRLLSQPEFGDLARLRGLLAALEHKERMIRLLDKVLSAGVNVAIGSELEDPEMQECALVAIPVGSTAGAGLGVIGPVRMPYDRVISAVRYVSDRITHYL